MHVAGLPRKLPSARWKLAPPSLERKMNDCVVLKPNGVLVYSCPRPAVGLRSTATSGSKPGWKFETTVGVSNPGLGLAAAGAADTSTATIVDKARRRGARP